MDKTFYCASNLGSNEVKRLNIATHPELATFHMAEVSLTPTRHALERASSKGVRLPSRLKVARGQVVEVELDQLKRVTKLVVRFPSKVSIGLDDVLVIVPVSAGLWTIVTCWTNHCTDTHKTLNLSRVA